MSIKTTLRDKEPKEKKKYIVECYFKTQEVYSNLETAKREVKNKKEHGRYKDVKLIELTETYSELSKEL